MRRVAGALMLVFGTVLVCWVGDNLFVERLPATEGLSPVPALVFSAALFYVGVKWVREKSAD